jgi:hypothetical protein
MVRTGEERLSLLIGGADGSGGGDALREASPMGVIYGVWFKSVFQHKTLVGVVGGHQNRFLLDTPSPSRIDRIISAQ